ncbi:hypothetical protein [Streptomyces sp. NPDC090022]|uniref:hypothetical protein n=1 Tax=Streptomyces sp. NPDC090022 TaxID=3365920 RepID=UPI0038068651
MTGAAALTGGSLRLIRTGLEISVLAAGWALGGTVGIGTVLYAVLVGPATQLFLPACAFRAPDHCAHPPSTSGSARTPRRASRACRRGGSPLPLLPRPVDDG